MADVGPTMTDSDRVTRRSVLKATGAAAAAGVVGAAPAAASFVPGQCVVVATSPSAAYDSACPPSGTTFAPPEGNHYEIVETCSTDGTLYARLCASWRPWVPVSALDYADSSNCHVCETVSEE